MSLSQLCICNHQQSCTRASLLFTVSGSMDRGLSQVFWQQHRPWTQFLTTVGPRPRYGPQWQQGSGCHHGLRWQHRASAWPHWGHISNSLSQKHTHRHHVLSHYSVTHPPAHLDCDCEMADRPGCLCDIQSSNCNHYFTGNFNSLQFIARLFVCL